MMRLVAPQGMEPAEQSRALVAILCGHDDWGAACGDRRGAAEDRARWAAVKRNDA
jgi:hypothetical protein